MQTTFSTTFILRSSKTKNGLTPIYCRITVNGNRVEFSVKKSVEEKNWSTVKKVKTYSSPHAKGSRCSRLVKGGARVDLV